MKIPTREEFPSHPGGQCTLALARDFDAPADEWKQGTLFLVAHLGLDHARIAAQAKHLKVGALPKRGPLYEEIDAAVRKIKAEHPYQIWIYRGWCVILTVLLVTSMVAYIRSGHPGLAALWGALVVSYAFNIFHCRIHHGKIVYGIKWLDRLTLPIYELIDRVFMSTPEFWIQHHKTHHLDTNTMSDRDVLDPLNNGIRVTEQSPYKAINQYQHVYAHVLMAFNLFLFPINNVILGGGSMWFFLLYYTILFALPVYVQGNWESIKVTCLVIMAASSVISHLFQVSHNHEGLGKVRLNFEKAATQDIDLWMVHQITEAISWGGYISNLVVGGINNQIEHHVAPCLCPVSTLLSDVAGLSPCANTQKSSKESGVLIVIGHTMNADVFVSIWRYSDRSITTILPLNCRKSVASTAFPTFVSILFRTHSCHIIVTCTTWVDHRRTEAARKRWSRIIIRVVIIVTIILVAGFAYLPKPKKSKESGVLIVIGQTMNVAVFVFIWCSSDRSITTILPLKQSGVAAINVAGQPESLIMQAFYHVEIYWATIRKAKKLGKVSKPKRGG